MTPEQEAYMRGFRDAVEQAASLFVNEDKAVYGIYSDHERIVKAIRQLRPTVTAAERRG